MRYRILVFGLAGLSCVGAHECGGRHIYAALRAISP